MIDKTLKKDDPAKSQNLRQRAYGAFRNALFSGAIKPGEFLSQRELCEKLDSPLGPMREALKALEVEGLVTLMAKRGIQVVLIDEAQLREAYQARMVIECATIRHFAEHAPESQIQRIQDITQAFVDRFNKSDQQDPALFREKARVDFCLHDEIMELYNNQILRRAFHRATEHVRIFRMNIGKSHGFFELPAMDEHLRILEALLKRDGDAAAEAMRAHLTGARDRAILN